MRYVFYLEYVQDDTFWLGLVTHAYNPRSLGGQGRRIAGAQELTSLGTIVTPVSTKNQNKLVARGDVSL